VRYETPDGGEGTGLDHGHFEVTEVEGVDGINGKQFDVSHEWTDPVKTVRIAFTPAPGSRPYVTGGVLVELMATPEHH
jgi:hypothetical protein